MIVNLNAGPAPEAGDGRAELRGNNTLQAAHHVKLVAIAIKLAFVVD